MKTFLLVFTVLFSMSAFAGPTRFMIHNNQNGLDFVVEGNTSTPPTMQPEWGKKPTITTVDITDEMIAKQQSKMDLKTKIQAIKDAKDFETLKAGVQAYIEQQGLDN